MKTKRYNPIRLKLSQMFVGEHDDAKRVVVPCALQTAKSVGLLFAVASDADLADASLVFNQMRNVNANVQALGYVVNRKELPKYQQQSYFQLITDNDFDFLLRPKGAMATNFAKSQFDVLVDLNSAGYYPLRQMLYNSGARFRVGRYSDNQPFDLMISIGDDRDAKYYFEQILFYLQKFN